jgi:ATP-dependent Clp protease ATP-binding subunit ClpA
MSAFTQYVRTTLGQAGREAQLDRSSKIEAQHVLLAISAQRDTPAARILLSAGLEPRVLHAAFERERAQSLRAAGVSLEGFGLPQHGAIGAANGGAALVTDLGASVRTALERGVSGVRRNPRPEHLLLGILQAEQGTVPRALALAGIDRGALILCVQQSLLKSAA